MRGVPHIPRGIKGGGGGGELIKLSVLLVVQLVMVLVWLCQMAWHYTGGLYLHRRKLARQASLDRALQLATTRVPQYVVTNHYQQPQYWYPPVHPQYQQPSPQPVPYVAVQHHTPGWTTYDNPWA